MGRLGGANVANPGAVCPLSQRTPAVPGWHWRKPHRGAMRAYAHSSQLQNLVGCGCSPCVRCSHQPTITAINACVHTYTACISYGGGGGYHQMDHIPFWDFPPKAAGKVRHRHEQCVRLGYGHAPYGDGLPRHGSRPAHRRMVPRMGVSQGFGQGTSNIIEYVATVQPSRYTRHFSWMDPDFLETLFPITMNFVDSRTECVHSGPPPSPPHNHGYRVRSR